MGNYAYKLILNPEGEGKEAYTYTYNYGGTKNIILTLKENTAEISVNMTVKYECKKALSKDVKIFSDAVKKALLVHLILFSKELKISRVIYELNGEKEEAEYTETNPLIYSMVSGDLTPKFKQRWDADAIETILNKPQSAFKKDSRMSALFAFICAKSKQFETERFVYLWMSFNGMYGYFSSLVEKPNKKIRWTENEQLLFLQKLYNYGNEIIPFNNKSEDNNIKEKEKKINEKRIIAQKVSAVIKGTPDEITKDYLYSEKGKVFYEKIKHILKRYTGDKKGELYDVKPYGYLLVQYSYYFRCTVIHADNPVLLFSFSDEGELRCLRTVNGILEEFIEENLKDWFTEKYHSEKIIPKAKEISKEKSEKKQKKQ